MNGITIDINPVILHLGHLELRWYSLAVLAGVLAAFFLAVKFAKRKGVAPGELYNAAPWVLLAGFLGARLFHVLDHLFFYLNNPSLILQIQQGGLAIWGALLGGGLAFVLYARSRHLPLGLLADALVPGLLVGQIIGRVGCIINGDAAGGPTGLPWGFISTNPASSISPTLLGVPTHPYPVYEMLWNGLSLLSLLALRRHLHRDGRLFAVYLSLYGLGRLVLTTVRHETVIFLGMQEAQILALGSLVLAGFIFWKTAKGNRLLKEPVREPL